jgi:hypothetical protein
LIAPTEIPQEKKALHIVLTFKVSWAKNKEALDNHKLTLEFITKIAEAVSILGIEGFRIIKLQVKPEAHKEREAVLTFVELTDAQVTEARRDKAFARSLLNSQRDN